MLDQPALSAPPAPPVAKQTKLNERPVSLGRVASIDVLRALTMILMIFVNDLGLLIDVPQWLLHVERGVDGIGLSDVVFPAFLFIVGLSLPFAITTRRERGETDGQLVKHILLRSLALVAMGMFLSNGERFNAEAAGMARLYWNPLCCLAFILIWNWYPQTANKVVVNVVRSIGIAGLIILAIIFQGGDDGEITGFNFQRWGILGSIGWAYLVGGLITLYSRNNFYAILGGWAFFCILSMVTKSGIIDREGFLSFIPGPILGGTLVGLTMGGVLTTYIFRHFRKKEDNLGLTFVLIGFSVVLIALSVYTRPFWGLMKIGATPAWLFLCSAFTILTFIAVYWLVDVGKKVHWFDIIKPAGTVTLLCYLVPYFMSFIRRFFGLTLPDPVVTGGFGLLKSFLFALLCVFVAGLLAKRAGVKLKV